MSRVGLTRCFVSETINLIRAGYWRQSLLGITFFPQWLATATNGRSPLHDQMPWITCSAVEFLRRRLTGSGIVFEWGSGGSTAFYAKLSQKVITVEHDPDWYQHVNERLDGAVRQRVELKLVTPKIRENNCNNDPGNPDGYCSSDAGYVQKSFEDYVKIIDEYPLGQFELVSIDGRARPSCLKHAIKHVAIGGYLLLDNSDRDYYLAKAPVELASWKRNEFVGPVNYSGMFGRTLIWQRTA